MAIYMLLALSALSAFTGALCSGAFGTLAWLWTLPLGFVLSFIGYSVLIFLLVCLMALAVDMKKPQEKDSPFYRSVVHLVIDLLIPILQIRLHPKGLEKAPNVKRVFLVCNHINDIDPAVLLHHFPQYRLSFISKRENEQKPIIGQFLYKIMCQSVNRENDREALKTILNCIRLLKEDHVSIAVFPEGYIHPDKKLHPFRSGVFKIALKTNVPIVVCTLTNTQYALSNARQLKPTDVDVHLLDVLYPQDYQGMTAVDIGNRVYEMMAQDLGPERVWQPES